MYTPHQTYPKQPISNQNTPTPFKPTATSLSYTAPNRFPIRRITAAQRDERRAQGLRFNSDDNFIQGHKCAAENFLLVMVDDDLPMDTKLNTDII